jgi:predicted transcriptional regulator
MTMRLTIRVDDELYTRLQLFAEGRRRSGRPPNLAAIVREAIEQYIVPRKWQPPQQPTKEKGTL